MLKSKKKLLIIEMRSKAAAYFVGAAHEAPRHRSSQIAKPKIRHGETLERGERVAALRVNYKLNHKTQVTANRAQRKQRREQDTAQGTDLDLLRDWKH